MCAPPRHGKAAAGRAWRVRVLKQIADRLHYFVSIRKSIIVPKANDAIPERCKIFASLPVRFRAVQMLRAVEFDNQKCLRRAEIRKEWSNRKLSPEFDAIQLSALKTTPQLFLRLGLRTPKFSRTVSA